MERRELRGVQLPCRAERVQARPPERLVGVDVPDAGEPPLIEQRRLERSPATVERLGEPPAREGAHQRFPADPLVEVERHVLLVQEQPRAEAAHVSVHDVRSVV